MYDFLVCRKDLKCEYHVNINQRDIVCLDWFLDPVHICTSISLAVPEFYMDITTHFKWCFILKLTTSFCLVKFQCIYIGSFVMWLFIYIYMYHKVLKMQYVMSSINCYSYFKQNFWISFLNYETLFIQKGFTHISSRSWNASNLFYFC